jgi:hypothetical protein
MNTWYKIAQQELSLLMDLKSQLEAIETPLRSLSEQYIAMPNKEEANEFWNREIEPYSKKRRDLKAQIEQETKRLLSLGLIDFEGAKSHGYLGSGHDRDGWKPLPKTLYHVTTAKSKVIQEGLKTRMQLDQGLGKGLGGGESNTISYTDDLKTAYAILYGILEMKAVVEGRLTVPKMIEMAKEGVGASKPYSEELIEGAQHAVGNLDDLANGYMSTSSLARPPDNESEWIPDEKSGWQGKDKRYYGRWKRKRTEDEQIHALSMFHSRFSSAREHAGGMENPLFFAADVKSLREVPESEIAILQFKPKPGAKGYKLGGLHEWRTGTGTNVDLVGEVPITDENIPHF